MNKILVTGSDGFIGSCLVDKLKNIKEKHIAIDVYDINSVNVSISKLDIYKYDTIIHLGAISETNYKCATSLFDRNILDTLDIFKRAKPKAHVIYASSASVYGEHSRPVSEISAETGVSLYAKSKKTIDDIVRNFLDDRFITGLRFFNVCSFDKEDHKNQPSPTFTFSEQIKSIKSLRLFHNSHLIFRDFIFIDTVIDIIVFFIFNYIPKKAEIFNVGSGIPVSFEQIADAIIKKAGYGKKIYIDKPTNLTDNYQSYTCADVTKLLNYGYKSNIPSILEHII